MLNSSFVKCKDSWWSAKTDKIQNTSERHDSKRLYTLFKDVYGPISSRVVPIRSMDGKTLLRDPVKISEGWQEHFDAPLNHPSSVDEDSIHSTSSMPIKESMTTSPTLEEVENALAKLNSGKSPGMDCLSPEIFKCGGLKFMQRCTNLLVNVWREERVPQEWKDALMIMLYK